MKLTKKNILIFALCAVLTLCFVICCVIYNKTADTLEAQHTAERWRGGSETPYAHISVFRSGSDAMNYGDIYSFRSGIKSALIGASFDVEANENLTNDAFCAESTISVSSARSKDVSATLYAVGGDFFVFHPMKLSSGSYIRERDLNDDLVVIDRELSWSLFGSVDTVGLPLFVGDREYFVAGVVTRDDDFFSKKTDGAVCCIYMPFAAVCDYNQNAITSYEVVMPNSVENFALDIVKGLASSGEIVENSTRFSLGNISDLIFSFGKRALASGGVTVPNWESAARLCEDYLSLITVIAAVCLLLPVIFTVVLIVLGYKALKKTGRRMVTKISDKIR